MAQSTLPDGLHSFAALVERNAQRFGARPAYREKEFGIWQSWTWTEARGIIRDLALGLLEMGVEKGDHVAIAGRTPPHFYWSMLACQYVGAIPVPVYQDSVADEMAYVLDHCGARFAVVEDQEQVDKLQEVGDRLPKLERIVYVDTRGMRKYDHARLISFDDWRRSGEAARDARTDELEARIAAADPDDVAIILYTSGTTGRPKGVVMTNRNVIVTAKNTCEFDGLTEKESILAYLPMAWVGDYVFSMAQACWAGFCVNCPESQHTMQQDLREIGPTYFFAPPRFFEGMLTSIMIRMEDAGWLKRKLFEIYVDHAKRIGPALLDGRKVGLLDRVSYGFGRLFVYGPLLNATGLSKVRVGYTAGEAIGPEIFEFYRALGINLKQLYGQTEACVFITQQPDGEVRADTVGVPSPDVEIRLGDSGEVFYRSPGTFASYYRNDEATAETKDAEGWVATGDAGFFEPDSGHLRIIDRAKDVGKLASGAMFAPKYVENKLKFFPNVLEAVAFGDGRDYCTAFVNIDLEAVGNWAERNQIAYASYQELAGHPRVYEAVQEHVEEVNRSIADDPMLSQCQIKRFLVLHKELDADDGELTRTRKVRRRIIAEKYGGLIDALYDGSDSVYVETEVTYEDGRKGMIKATLEIRDAETYEPAQAAPMAEAAE